MLSLADGGKNLEENTEENQAEIIVIENDAVRYSSSKDATFQRQVYQFFLSGLQTMVLCRVLFVRYEVLWPILYMVPFES